MNESGNSVSVGQSGDSRSITWTVGDSVRSVNKGAIDLVPGADDGWTETRGVTIGNEFGIDGAVHGKDWDDVLSTIEPLKTMALDAKKREAERSKQANEA